MLLHKRSIQLPFQLAPAACQRAAKLSQYCCPLVALHCQCTARAGTRGLRAEGGEHRWEWNYSEHRPHPHSNGSQVFDVIALLNVHSEI